MINTNPSFLRYWFFNRRISATSSSQSSVLSWATDSFFKILSRSFRNKHENNGPKRIRFTIYIIYQKLVFVNICTDCSPCCMPWTGYQRKSRLQQRPWLVQVEPSSSTAFFHKRLATIIDLFAWESFAAQKILTESNRSENLIDRSKFLVFFIPKALHQSSDRIFSEYAWSYQTGTVPLLWHDTQSIRFWQSLHASLLRPEQWQNRPAQKCLHLQGTNTDDRILQTWCCKKSVHCADVWFSRIFFRPTFRPFRKSFRYTGTCDVFGNDAGRECFFIDFRIHRQCGFPICFPKSWCKENWTDQKMISRCTGVRRMFCSSCLYSHWNITYSNFLTVPWQRWNCPGLSGIRGLYEMARLLLHLYGNQNGNRWGSSWSWNHAPVPYANMVNLAIRLSVALICAPHFGIVFVWLAVPAG